MQTSDPVEPMPAETFSFDNPDILHLNSRWELLTASVQLHNQSLLEVVIAEAVTGEALGDVGPISGARSLEIRPESRRYVFSFLNFVSYAVTEEMLWKTSDEDRVVDTSNGRVRQLSRSPFLSFVRASTWAEDYYDKDPLLHFQLITLDHTVDVVTTRPPEFCGPSGS